MVLWHGHLGRGLPPFRNKISNEIHGLEARATKVNWSWVFSSIVLRF
jgi:hypothetical protein